MRNVFAFTGKKNTGYYARPDCGPGMKLETEAHLPYRANQFNCHVPCKFA